MALKQVEGRSAARRSRPSLNVARQTDTMQIAPEASEIQIACLRRRFDFSPALAGVVASLAYPQIDNWRGAR